MSSSTQRAPGSRALQDALEHTIADTIAPSAVQVDHAGMFPTGNIQALGAAGVLGLLSAVDVGGAGLGLRASAETIERLSAACGSTAMIVLMHFAAVQVIEAHGPREVREAVAAGRHLSSLAFSESGSRSHFWAPQGTATPADDRTPADGQTQADDRPGPMDRSAWMRRKAGSPPPDTPTATSGVAAPWRAMAL